MTASEINNDERHSLRPKHGSAEPSHGERVYYPSSFHDIDAMVEECWQSIRKEIIRHGYTESEVKIHMALAEALINAWKHGHGRNKKLPIIFRWHFDHQFTFEVLDQGPGFNFRSLPDPTNREKITDDNGRGIFIIRTFAQEVDWRDHGRHLVVSFSHP